jgi:hypothetical protein
LRGPGPRAAAHLRLGAGAALVAGDADADARQVREATSTWQHAPLPAAAYVDQTDGGDFQDARSAHEARLSACTDPAAYAIPVEEIDAAVLVSAGGDDRVWDVIGNQVVMHQWRFGPGDDAVFNLDQWDGYPQARGRMLQALGAATGDVVVLTGDVHSTWIADLREDFLRGVEDHARALSLA